MSKVIKGVDLNSAIKVDDYSGVYIDKETKEQLNRIEEKLELLAGMITARGERVSRWFLRRKS